MKRILIFSLNYFPYASGAEIAIKEITDRLPDIEFHIVPYRFDSNWPKEERIGNVRVHRVGFGKKGTALADSYQPLFYFGKILYVPLAAYRGWRLHKELGFTGGWAMMSYMVFPFVLMRMAGCRIPYLLTLQDGDPFERVFKRKRLRPFLPLLTYGFKKAARVQAISSYLLSWARRIGYAGPGEVIPNGVSLAHFSQTFPEDEIAYVKKELGIGPQDIVLVTTSRLVHKNAVDTVIDALPKLPETVKFVICGVGPLERALQARVEMLKLGERVIFLGEVSQAELPLLLSACDIFIRPSRTEGLGISFIEAMAAGLPVIATQEGGLSDFLFDPKRNPDVPPTGFAVDAGSPDQIAETVQSIIADPAGTKEVVANARELVKKEYDWDSIAVRMRLLFDYE